MTIPIETVALLAASDHVTSEALILLARQVSDRSEEVSEGMAALLIKCLTIINEEVGRRTDIWKAVLDENPVSPKEGHA